MLLMNDEVKPENDLAEKSITAGQSCKQHDRLGLLRALAVSASVAESEHHHQ